MAPAVRGSVPRRGREPPPAPRHAPGAHTRGEQESRSSREERTPRPAGRPHAARRGAPTGRAAAGKGRAAGGWPLTRRTRRQPGSGSSGKMAGLMVDRAPGRGGTRLPLSAAAPHFPRRQETPGQVPARGPALPASTAHFRVPALRGARREV